MKTLTLEQAWSRCLTMWRWIVAEKTRRKDATIATLKKEWLKRHRPDDCPYINCYFCEYGVFRSGVNMCTYCPGRLVSPAFRCDNLSYHYCDKPAAFFRKIEALNRKRKAGKKGAST